MYGVLCTFYVRCVLHVSQKTTNGIKKHKLNRIISDTFQTRRKLDFCIFQAVVYFRSSVLGIGYILDGNLSLEAW